MAEVSANGNYVKFQAHVWYDEKADVIKVTSRDKDMPSKGIHLTAKKGSETDLSLRALMAKFGCGPDAKKVTVGELFDEINEISDLLALHVSVKDDENVDKAFKKLTELQKKAGVLTLQPE